MIGVPASWEQSKKLGGALAIVAFSEGFVHDPSRYRKRHMAPQKARAPSFHIETVTHDISEDKIGGGEDRDNLKMTFMTAPVWSVTAPRIAP